MNEITKPNINIHINDNPIYIELTYCDDGINGVKYSTKILPDNIPITGFNIYVFYKLLTDIINKKENSELIIKEKDNKNCLIQCSIILDDYINTEYKFVLILYPVDEINILKNENKLMKTEITELKHTLNTIDKQLIENNKLKVKDLIHMTYDMRSLFINDVFITPTEGLNLKEDKPQFIGCFFDYFTHNIFAQKPPNVTVGSTAGADHLNKYYINPLDALFIHHDDFDIWKIFGSKLEFRKFIANKHNFNNFISNKYMNINLDTLNYWGNEFKNKFSSCECRQFELCPDKFVIIAFTILFIKYLDENI